MTLPGTDDFGINQDPLAGDWTVADDFGSELLRADSGLLKGRAGDLNFGHCYFWNADAFGNDQYAKGIVVAPNNFPALIVRQRNSDDLMYWAYFHPSRIYVQEYDGAGGWTSVTGGSYINYSMDNESVFELRVSGIILSVWDDEVQIGSDYTDATIDSGSAGVGSAYTVNETVGIFTDWEGGNLGAVGGRTTKNPRAFPLGINYGTLRM